jgi:hypothetical protein
MENWQKELIEGNEKAAAFWAEYKRLISWDHTRSLRRNWELVNNADMAANALLDCRDAVIYDAPSDWHAKRIHSALTKKAEYLQELFKGAKGRRMVAA